MRLYPALITVIFSLALVACGDDEQPASTAATETAGAATTAADVCEPAEAPEPQDVKLDKPPSKPSSDDLVATVETTCGSFEIALDTKNDPKTVASFEYMVDNGVYDGTSFHRVVPGFVIQGGDPLGNGTGGPGYSVVEPPPRNTAYTEGVVAMAKSGVEPPGTSGSQFFVVTGADAGLPPDYAVLGEVTSGIEVVHAIEALGDPSSPEGTPTEPVLIKSITIA